MVRSEVRTIRRTKAKQERRRSPGEGPRERLLAAMPVTERRLDLHGVSTAVLEGGDGPPVVFLHGPGEYAAKWMQVIPDLAKTHRVVAPDLPGHGASSVTDGRLDAQRVCAWLGELIQRTCVGPPALVGHILGGAIAARFACGRRVKLSRLVLVDALGLAPFQPAPELGRALTDFLAHPDGDTHDGLWQRCAFDLDSLRRRLGPRWELLRAYNLDRARAPGLQAAQHNLMEELGLEALPPPELARITIPTTLIWGRHDLATRLELAEAASLRYGWPLHVIENAADDPPLEQHEAFLRVLRVALTSAPRADQEEAS